MCDIKAAKGPSLGRKVIAGRNIEVVGEGSGGWVRAKYNDMSVYENFIIKPITVLMKNKINNIEYIIWGQYLIVFNS